MEARRGKERTRPYSAVIVAALVGLMATAAVVLVSELRFAYRNPELHLVLETLEGMIALLTGYLMWGRYKRSYLERDLVLVFGLVVLGLSNLAFSVVPKVLEVDPEAVIRTWTPVATRFFGGVAFAFAAVLPRRELRDTRKALRNLIAVVVGMFALVVTVIEGFGSTLPPVIESEFTAEGSAGPDLSADPVFTAIQVALVIPYALASFGFLRRFLSTGDDLIGWFAAGTVLSAFARVQYALYPSLYSDFFYSGDVLRLGFYLLLLLGATREIRAHWESLAAARALEERRQLAHDLHDGIAQEMTFLAGQVARLQRHGEVADPEVVDRIRGATERAVAETRRAISALQGQVHEPLDVALRETALRTFPAEPPLLQLSLEPGIEVAPRERERIIRIAREALVNAARHSGAASVEVTLTREPGGIAIEIRDDGNGFDPDAEYGGFGLLSMKERVRNLGGEVSIRSQPGEGTTVRMVFGG